MSTGIADGTGEASSPSLSSYSWYGGRLLHTGVMQVPIEASSIYILALMMSTKAGLRLAPPTKKPSMSSALANSLQFFSLTLPP